MAPVIEEFSTLTDRFQTTVPASVRKQLKLRKRDKIRFLTESNGRVYVEPVREDERDPVIGAFLDFIEADLQKRPDRIVPLSGDMHDRMKALVGDMDVDLDASLSPDDE